MRVRELTIQYSPHPSGARIDNRAAADPKSAAAILVPMLCDQAQEIAVVLLLDTRRRLLAIYEASRGSLTHCDMDPRIIFRAAIVASATGIILAHNHPSGDPTPSPDDHQVTTRLQAAGKLLGIEVLDHLIVGNRQYVSFKETGRI